MADGDVARVQQVLVRAEPVLQFPPRVEHAHLLSARHQDHDVVGRQERDGDDRRRTVESQSMQEHGPAGG